MLTNWCKPPDASLWSAPESPGTLGARVDVLTERLESTERYEVALIGSGPGADRVRAALYALQDANPELALLDLGNLRRAEADFAVPLLQELFDARILPIWIGAAASLTSAIVNAYRILDRKLQLGSLHPSAGYGETAAVTNATYAVLGYQTHLTPPAHLVGLRENGVQLLRLGEIRERVAHTEPLLRNLDLLNIHAGSLPEYALPAQLQPTSVGLSVAEVCQIAYYAGASDRLCGLTLGGWHPTQDTNGQSARALATIIWYFLDGVAHRQGDFPISKTRMTEFVVHAPDTTGELTFWKSERSGRWWVEVQDEAADPPQKHLLACNHTDYTELLGGRITPYLLQLLGRFA